MLAQGVQARVLQEVLGHAQIQVTLGTYGHVLPQQKKAAAQAVDNYLAAVERKASDALACTLRAQSPQTLCRNCNWQSTPPGKR